MMETDRLILDGFIPYRLSVTTNAVSGVIASAYEALFGLTIPEWRVIAVVSEREGITQQEVCAASRMDKVTVSRATLALVGRQLIIRAPNSADRRSRLLTLTKEGRALYAQVTPKALELEKRIFERFPVAERERFIAMLRAVEDHAVEVAAESLKV